MKNINIDYLKSSVNSLSNLNKIGDVISIYNSDVAKTLRTSAAEACVRKIFLHITSALALLRAGIERYEKLDISLICSAARNVMECTNIYFYITERGLSEEEFNVRYNLLFLNEHFNENLIISKLNFPQNEDKDNLKKFTQTYMNML